MADELGHRRVVTGRTPNGRSTVVSDGLAPVTMQSDAFSLVETWRIAGLPTDFGPPETVDGPAALDPAPGQVLLRFCHFYPESAGTDWEAALGAIGGEETYDPEAERPGVHETDTLDHIVVMSGQIHLLLDEAEVVLNPGDTLVQRGTSHSWSNRSSAPCVVMTVQVKAQRT